VLTTYRRGIHREFASDEVEPVADFAALALDHAKARFDVGDAWRGC
jgi:hypothetical protein